MDKIVIDRAPHGRLLRFLAPLVGLLVVGACSSAGSEVDGSTPTTGSERAQTTTSTAPDPIVPEASTTTTAPPPPEIRSIDLRAHRYRALCPTDPSEVELAIGQPTPTPGGSVIVDVFEPTYGEIDGDGREDAVIQITCALADGGNATTSSVVLVSSESDGPRQIGAPIEGFAPVVYGQTVVVSRSIYEEGDARCCPSTTRYQPLTFQVDHLAEGGGGSPVGSGTEATTGGLGGFAAGRTYAEVAAATGQAVEAGGDPEITGDCRYVSLVGGPAEVSGLGDVERLRSIEITDPAIRTSSGLGVGSAEGDIYAAFPGRVTAQEHEYIDGGKYLVFTPAETPEQIAVFDTDGSQVVHYRVGDAGWAGAIEGCL